MFTASHNPARYNGIKFCRAGARRSAATPAWPRSGRRAERYLADGPAAGGGPGTVEQVDLLADYARYLRGLVDLAASAR